MVSYTSQISYPSINTREDVIAPNFISNSKYHTRASAKPGWRSPLRHRGHLNRTLPMLRRWRRTQRRGLGRNSLAASSLHTNAIANATAKRSRARVWAVLVAHSLPGAPDVVVIQLGCGHIFAEEVPADKPGEVFLDLEGHEATLGDGEDEIEIFEGAALGFFDEEEHEDEGEDIETGEQPERAAIAQTAFSVADRRVENREQTGEEEVDGNGPGCTGFTVGEWETLRRKGEWDGTQARGVGNGKHWNNQLPDDHYRT